MHTNIENINYFIGHTATIPIDSIELQCWGNIIYRIKLAIYLLIYIRYVVCFGKFNVNKWQQQQKMSPLNFKDVFTYWLCPSKLCVCYVLMITWKIISLFVVVARVMVTWQCNFSSQQYHKFNHFTLENMHFIFHYFQKADDWKLENNSNIEFFYSEISTKNVRLSNQCFSRCILFCK